MSKNDEYKKLRNKWYEKLANEGFEDIEKDEENLKAYSFTLFRASHCKVKAAANEEYYRLAGHFLHDYPFESVKDRAIWAMHSTGISMEKIATELKAKDFKVNKKSVNETILKLARIMVDNATKNRPSDD